MIRVGGVDARVAERLLVDAALAVGLDGRAGLRRDDDRRTRPSRLAVEGREHLARLGRVEDHERHAGGLGDDLGRERRSAHAGEHDVRDALGLELLRGAPRSRGRAGGTRRRPRSSRGASTPRPRRPDPTASASWAVMPHATRSATRPGTVRRTASAAAPLTEMRKLIVPPPARCGPYRAARATTR